MLTKRTATILFSFRNRQLAQWDQDTCMTDPDVAGRVRSGHYLSSLCLIEASLVVEVQVTEDHPNITTGLRSAAPPPASAHRTRHSAIAVVWCLENCVMPLEEV